MNRVAKVFLTSALVLFLAGCSGTQLEKAQRVSPEGSAFNVGLYQGYIVLASSEYKEGDYEDSDNFAVRAMTAGVGETVGPEEISARQLPENKVGELSSARRRFSESLGKGAAQKVPEETARAQIGFDCWMQEQEENFQPDNIEACRSQFFAALAVVENALKPIPVAAKAEPPAAPPAAPQIGGPYVVFFNFDSAELSDAAETVLETASSTARKLDGMRVTVSGHADLAGPASYNVDLSKRRAIAVSQALIGTGVASTAIEVEALGQTDPAVATADGVSEADNRRVEIILRVE